MIDWKELRRIALAATPGQWVYDLVNGEIEAEKGRRGICAFHGLTEFLDDNTERKIYSFEQDDNANHICAFSPLQALALLDELERCRAALSTAQLVIRSRYAAERELRATLELIANQAIAHNALGEDK